MNQKGNFMNFMNEYGTYQLAKLQTSSGLQFVKDAAISNALLQLHPTKFLVSHYPSFPLVYQIAGSYWYIP